PAPPARDRLRHGSLHGSMAGGQRLDPRRIDIVAAANDHVLLAPGDAQIAVLVDPAEIAGHEPAVAIERFFRRLLIVEIAEHEAGAAAADLPDLARRQFAVGVVPIEDADLIYGAGLPAAFRDQRRIVAGHRVLV